MVLREWKRKWKAAKSTARKKEMSVTFDQIKDWFTFAVAVVSVVAGVIFWVQTSNDGKVERIEEDIVELKSDIKKIQDDNREIIRIMGRLEGLIDK